MSKRKSFRLAVKLGKAVVKTVRVTALSEEELERKLWLVFKTDFDSAVMALTVCGLEVWLHDGLNRSRSVCCFEEAVDFMGVSN